MSHRGHHPNHEYIQPFLKLIRNGKVSVAEGKAEEYAAVNGSPPSPTDITLVFDFTRTAEADRILATTGINQIARKFGFHGTPAVIDRDRYIITGLCADQMKEFLTKEMVISNHYGRNGHRDGHGNGR